MTWDGQVLQVRMHEVFGAYAFSRLTSPTYWPVTTDCLFLTDYPPHIRSQMVVPGWRFRWTITKDVDRLEPALGSL